MNVAENLGIETTVSFITGYPEEEKNDLNDTLDMLGKCFRRPQESCTPQLHILLPEPGTPMFLKRENELTYDGYVTKFNARLLGSNDLAQIRSHPDLYSTYYYYPAALPRSSYTFAVDAVDAFRCAGHEILSYALRFFQGQMSKMIADFHAWVGKKHYRQAVNPKLVIDFFTDKFGSGHHLTSLFRFGVGMHARKKGDDRNTNRLERPVFHEKQLYLLNPQASLFSALHDCGELLSRIRKLPNDADFLSATEVGDQTAHLVIESGDIETHYRLGDGIESILRLFETPRSTCEVLELLSEISPDSSINESFFERLVSIGALVPTLRRRERRRADARTKGLALVRYQGQLRRHKNRGKAAERKKSRVSAAATVSINDGPAPEFA